MALECGFFALQPLQSFPPVKKIKAEDGKNKPAAIFLLLPPTIKVRQFTVWHLALPSRPTKLE